MIGLFLTTTVINDTIDYVLDPSNRGEIIFQLILIILGIILTWFLAIFCKPIHKFIINIRKCWDSYRINPNLEMEISISGNIPPVASHDFVLKMHESLSNVSGSITTHAGDSFEFSKNFNSFIGNIIISPGLDSQTNNYNYIFIKLKTTDIKLKKIKDGLSEIQIYLFRDVVGAIIQKLNFVAEKNNEGISVKLPSPPTIFRLTGGLNIEDITASEDGIRITFSKDNININGSIEPRTLEKIEEIIRSNLAT